MIKLSTTLVASAALVVLSACGSSTDGAASSAAAKSSGAAAKATGSAAATAAAKPAPEMADVKNEKRKLSFKAPKDIKADPSGESYSWDTMQIMVEQTLDPVAKNEDLMKIAPASTSEGATPESSTEGEVLISSWKQKEGPAWAVCGQKGKSVALRIGFEPAHKDVAMGICKSLKVD